MKHFYFFAASLLIAVGASAAVLTVDNNNSSPGQYTTLQAAITAANVGDSIYVSGSINSYGSATLNKRLVIFGTGYNPAKQNPLVSTTGTLTMDTVTSVSGASGSKIYGLNIGTISDNYGMKNMVFERNYFNSTNVSLNANANNDVFRDNVFNNGGFYLYNATNILIENNLLYNGAVYYSNSPSLIINHNVFMAPASATYCLYQISFAAIMNNIFWGPTPLGTSVVNNVFTNNLTFQTSNDVIPGASNSGSGNLVATNPQFVTVPTPAIDFTDNYNVANASAAHNGGSDGTDLGVFGGANPLPNLTGMPAIPQMIDMLISNPIVAPAGNLNVSFKAKKNN